MKLLSVSWPHPTWCGMWVQLVYSNIPWKFFSKADAPGAIKGMICIFKGGGGGGGGGGGQTLEGSLQVEFPL